MALDPVVTTLQRRSIYALRVNTDNATVVFESLKRGEGRFGWSYAQTADLKTLRERIEKSGWGSLEDHEQKCYQPFLLELKEDDYVIYINVPVWGECSAARVTEGYFFKWDDKDFNHRFPVDSKSVFSFSRNSESVPPRLRARLKLQQRKWQIGAASEFEHLLESRKTGTLSASPYSGESDRRFLSKKLDPLLLQITRQIHDTHPNYALEGLVAAVIKRMPSIIKDSVKWQGGAGDHGADILFDYEELTPFVELGSARTRKVVVQVKSFKDEHWDTQAVDDIERALDKYQADSGLIISTADKSSDTLDRKLEELRSRTGKPIGLMIGRDVARFVLKYGQELIPRDGNA